MKDRSKLKVTVIGGGLGGIATSLRLSKLGFNVTLMEKNSNLGGKLSTFNKNGYQFDMGPSLITLPQYFRELYSDLGEDIDNHLKLERLDPMCRYKFQEGQKFDYFSSMGKLREEFKLVNENFENFENFLNIGSKIYNISDKTFLNNPVLSRNNSLRPKDLLGFPFTKTISSYDKLINNLFNSEMLKRIFNRYPTYIGSSPYNSPAMFLIIPYIEYAFGSWYVKGGLYQIIQSLKKLMEKNNVKLLDNCTVEKINTTIQDGKKQIHSVLTSQGIFDSDIVINNGDSGNTNQLLGKPNLEKVDDYSMSGYVLMLGVKKKFNSLEHHNILFSKDYKKEFNNLFKERCFPEEPTVYICNSSKTDPTAAPDGCSNLFIMANAPASNLDWTKFDTEKARASVIETLNVHNIHLKDNEIEVEKCLTPNYFKNQHLSIGGSLYGKNSHGLKNSFFRNKNKDPKIKGLFHVGGTSHPGGGTPTVIRSSKITANLINNEY